MDLIKYLPSLITDFFTKGHERSIKIKKNIIASFGLQGISILISFVQVPLTLHYVNPTRYGIWITLSSIITWFNLFDIGLGNGLRNKFAEALAKNDVKLAKTYVSTTYAMLSLIIIPLLLIFIIVNPFINWATAINTPNNMSGELSILALGVFFFFSVNFILKLINTILVADQKPSFSNLLNTIASIISLIIIFLLTKFTEGNLLYLGITFSAIPPIVLLISSIALFNTKYKLYLPSIKYIDFSFAKNLISLGGRFFILQIAAVIIYQSDMIIIAQLFTPEDVTPYNLSFRYFNMVMVVFNFFIAPLWSAFTEAFVKEEIKWIKDVIRKTLRIWFGFIFITILLFLFSNIFFQFWVGNTVKVPHILSFVLMLYFIVIMWNGIYSNFLNGVGKIRMQMNISLIGTIINIPLAIIFVKVFHFGVEGVLMSSLILNLISAIVAPIQYNLIINKRATGIWNK